MMRTAIWSGEVKGRDPSDASSALAARAMHAACVAFDTTKATLRELHVNRSAAEIWERTCDARAALAADVQAHVAIVRLARELGFGARLCFDRPRLRIITPRSHENAAAARAFFAHRDTWYGNPRAQINVWIPLFDTDASDSFAIFPRAFGVRIENDSASFDYAAFSAEGGFGVNAQSAAFPRCANPPGEAQYIVARAGAVVLFSAAHLHRTTPNKTSHTRLSVDTRLVDLDDADHARGAPDDDNASRGTALVDYLRAEHR